MAHQKGDDGEELIWKFKNLKKQKFDFAVPQETFLCTDIFALPQSTKGAGFFNIHRKTMKDLCCVSIPGILGYF